MGSVEIIDISLARRKGESLDLVTEQTSLHTRLEDPQRDSQKSSIKQAYKMEKEIIDVTSAKITMDFLFAHISEQENRTFERI